MSQTHVVGDEMPKVRVVLLHADVGVRERVQLALSRQFDVQPVDSLDEVASALGRSPYEVLVTDWRDGLFECVQSAPTPVRIVHFGPTLPDPLIEAAGQGQEISHVDRLPELHRRILELTRPRRSRVTRHATSALSVRWSGARHDLTLLELSNRGFSCAVPLGDDIEPFVPGASLSGLSISGGRSLILEGARAVVRHLEPEVDHYRLGCMFTAPTSTQRPGQLAVLRDRGLCAGLLRAALRGPGLLLSSGEDRMTSAHFSGGSVDGRTGIVALSGSMDGLEPFDVVQGRFELGGSFYRFDSAVVGLDPLRMKLPQSLDEVQSRSSPRRRLGADEPVRVELSSALLRQPVLRRVVDLSSSGFAFDLVDEDLFPPGLVLPEVVLRLGEEVLRARGQVRNLTRLADRPETLRCGVALELDESDRLRLADFLVRHRLPGIEDGGAASFDELMALFAESGLLGEERQSENQLLLPQMRQTFARLGRRQSSMFKSVIVRDGGRIVGHASAARVYQGTWFIQHLAAIGAHNASYALNMGSAEFFGQLGELEYCQVGYHAHNRWPARVFGSFARKIRDPLVSELKGICWYTLPTSEVPKPQGPVRELTIVEARGRELGVVEQHFVRSESVLRLRAEDLTISRLNLDVVDAGYRRLGLFRQRRVLLALDKDEPVGFLLAEVSSPGLNLSEYFSAFRVYVLGEPDADQERVVRWNLLRAAVELFRDEGRPFARGLAAASESEALARLGLRTSEPVMIWTCHRRMFRRFADYVDRLFEGLLARRRLKGQR